MFNKKIKNATKKVYNGVLYRSSLEASVAEYLTANNIEFKYECMKFELLPSVKYNGKSYRAIHYTPDFLCGDYIIEVKGFPNDRWPIVEKLMIHKIVNDELIYKFRVVHSIKELKAVINEMNEYGSTNK